MESAFSGAALRLARVYHGLALEELGDCVGKTRQYIHKLETGQGQPTSELVQAFCGALRVMATFFTETAGMTIAEDQVHFRGLLSTRPMIRNIALAKAEVFSRLVEVLEKELEFPHVDIPTLVDAKNAADVERAAELCRSEWGLGLGPISNMTRVAENAGAVVTTFRSVSREIDATSVSARRPIIVRNLAKESVCRQRFDVGHEIGHFALHQGRQTGDRITESEANRFAGALMVPRAMMGKLFPRPRGARLDWRAISNFKLTWKISKAAAIYRARQLDLLTEDQFRSAFITLKRTGEAVHEREDHLIAPEPPELLYRSLELLRKRKGITLRDIASALHVEVAFIEEFIFDAVSTSSPEGSSEISVVDLGALRASRSPIGVTG
jgi:Zn-dependent peptidase ImmA (M78 family)